MTKFTRSRKEVLKYINKQIKNYKEVEEYYFNKSDENRVNATSALFILKHLKRFMTEKTDWI